MWLGFKAPTHGRKMPRAVLGNHDQPYSCMRPTICFLDGARRLRGSTRAHVPLVQARAEVCDRRAQRW